MRCVCIGTAYAFWCSVTPSSVAQLGAKMHMSMPEPIKMWKVQVVNKPRGMYNVKFASMSRSGVTKASVENKIIF
jgi:hypothetical protein